jgi:hypothetical protein
MNSNSDGPSVFTDALNLTLSELTFPDSTELFERRIRMLQKFTSAALPDSLVSKTTDAISATQEAQSACDLFLVLAKTSAGLSIDSAGLFQIAALALENEAATLAIDDKTREITKSARLTFLNAVIGGLKSEKDNRTFREVLEACLVGADGLTATALTTQATLLVAKQKQLAALSGMLANLAKLGLIWRGLFYAAVIGKAGGSLEKELATQKVMDVVADASSKVLGVIPIAGEMFDIAKTIIKLYSVMRHKEDHIDELVQQVQSAQEYIDKYGDALALWMKFSVTVQDTMAAFISPFRHIDLGTEISANH